MTNKETPAQMFDRQTREERELIAMQQKQTRELKERHFSERMLLRQDGRP